MSTAGLPIQKDVEALAKETKKVGNKVVEGVVKLDHTPVDTEGAPTTVEKALAGTNAGMRDPDCNAAPSHDRECGIHGTVNFLKEAKEAVKGFLSPILPEKKEPTTDHGDEKKEADPTESK